MSLQGISQAVRSETIRKRQSIAAVLSWRLNWLGLCGFDLLGRLLDKLEDGVFSCLFCFILLHGLAFNKVRVDQWECHVCYAFMPEAKWCCRSMQSGGGSAEFDAHNPLSKQGGCKAFQPPGRVEVVLGQVTNAHKRRFMSCIKVVGFCNFSTGFMSIRLSLLCLGH